MLIGGLLASYMMCRLSFSEKWRGWIKECISSSSFFVVAKGSPYHLFKSYRGLRQGDPLSPFSFTMVAEALNVLLLKVKVIDIICGFEVGRSREIIIHLQFTDDTILFVPNSGKEIVVLKRILRCFELYLGLKVHRQKNILVGVSCSEEILRPIANFPHYRLVNCCCNILCYLLE